MFEGSMYLIQERNETEVPDPTVVDDGDGDGDDDDDDSNT
jgi:hypothetical protein